MKNLINRFSFGLTALLLSTPAWAADESDPEDCTIAVESNGIRLCAESDQGAVPWADDTSVQTGPDTWAVTYDGHTETWVETAPNDYEILEPAEMPQQGGPEAPVPPGPVAPQGPPPPPAQPPPAQPLEVHIGAYQFNPDVWTHEGAPLSARMGRYGASRMVARPPTASQLAELEFGWSLFKAGATHPYVPTSVVVTEMNTEVVPDLDAPPGPSFGERMITGDFVSLEQFYMEALGSTQTYFEMDGFEMDLMAFEEAWIHDEANKCPPSNEVLDPCERDAVERVRGWMDLVRDVWDLIDPYPDTQDGERGAAIRAQVEETVMRAFAHASSDVHRGVITVETGAHQVMKAAMAALAPYDRSAMLSTVVAERELGGVAVTPGAIYVLPEGGDVGK